MAKPTNKGRDIAKQRDGLGDRRHNRYRAAFDRAQQAMQDRYYLEAITLFDSLIFDRLGSRLNYLIEQIAKVDPQRANKLKTGAGELHGTGQLCKQLVGKDGSGGCEDIQSFRKAIQHIQDWTKQRNKAVHSTADVYRSDTSDQSFRAILASHKDTAEKAREYLREFDKLDTQSRSDAKARPPASSPNAFFPEKRKGSTHASDWKRNLQVRRSA